MPNRRRFTVDEYHRMAAAGILTQTERVELIDGEIVEMSSIGGRHAGQVKRLKALFAARFAPRAIVSVQDPIRLSGDSEARPDLALLRPRPDVYRHCHPQGADVFVIVEVTDASVEFDRRVKAPLHAKTGIPEAWLVEANADHVEVYEAPALGGYRDVRILRRGETLTPEAFPDLTLTIEAVL